MPIETVEPNSEDVSARTHRRIVVGVGLMFLIAPTFLYPFFLMKVMCFSLFALSFSVLFGNVGLLCFGHAAFFGMASYISAYALKSWNADPEFAVLLGAVAAAGMGVVLGALAIRRRGLYFSMITLALAQMVYFISLRAPFTGGENGIQGVPRGRVFGLIPLDNAIALYGFVLIVFLAGLLFVYRLMHSPFGKALAAVKENERRAVSLGYRVNRHKLLAFTIAAGLAGVAGATKAVVFQLASLHDVHFAMSGEVAMMALIGGANTFLGPIVGAVIVLTLENFLVSQGSSYTIIQGAVFVVCVLLFRDGICGVLSRQFRMTL